MTKDLRLNDYPYLYSLFLYNAQGKFFPKFIIPLISSLFEEFPPRNILDLFAGVTFEETLKPLMKKFKPKLAIGLGTKNCFIDLVKTSTPEELVKKFIELLYKNELHKSFFMLEEMKRKPIKAFSELKLEFSKISNIPIEWKFGDISQILNKIQNSFDLIFGCQPFKDDFIEIKLIDGKKKDEINDKIKFIKKKREKEYEIKLDEIIIKASRLIDSQGVCFFLVKSSFFIKFPKFHDNLTQYGLYVDSVLEIPHNLLHYLLDETRILITIRRGKPSKLFVGEFSSEFSSMQTMINNLNSHKEGKVPQLGALVDPNSFLTLQHLIIEKEIDTLAQDLNLKKHKLSEIALEINFPKNNTKLVFIDKDNAIYLPLIGLSLSYDSIFDLKTECENYIQIVLDPEKAIANYVVNFLNTSLGKKIRNSWQPGTTLLKITKSILENASLYLPNMNTQLKIVTVHSKIRNYLLEFDNLKRHLWNHPNNYRILNQYLDSLTSKAPPFLNWIDSLPYPLATILWIYNATDNLKEKIDHLLNFFEALSEFIVMLLLSPFIKDKDFYIQECGYIKAPYPNWLKKPTFSTWVSIGNWLSKTIRRIQSDKDKLKWERCIEIFGKPEEEFLNMLIQKDLYKILETNKNYRNEWKGHPGITPRKQELERRLFVLESDLDKVREHISDNFSNVLLISPINMKFTEEGVYKIQVKHIIGTRYPFKTINVETHQPMEENKLYLLHSDYKTPIMLLPFVQILQSSKTKDNACYFYNRIEGEYARFVSYHYDIDPEINLPKDILNNSLSMLENVENKKDKTR